MSDMKHVEDMHNMLFGKFFIYTVVTCFAVSIKPFALEMANALILFWHMRREDHTVRGK